MPIQTSASLGRRFEIELRFVQGVVASIGEIAHAHRRWSAAAIVALVALSGTSSVLGAWVFFGWQSFVCSLIGDALGFVVGLFVVATVVTRFRPLK